MGIALKIGTFMLSKLLKNFLAFYSLKDFDFDYTLKILIKALFFCFCFWIFTFCIVSTL